MSRFLLSISARRNFFGGGSEVHQGRAYKGVATWGARGKGGAPRRRRSFQKICKKAMKILQFFKKFSRKFSDFFKILSNFWRKFVQKFRKFRNMHLWGVENFKKSYSKIQRKQTIFWKISWILREFFIKKLILIKK